MKVPNADLAVIPESKVRNYLLNTGHPIGGSKAAFFRKAGFTGNGWWMLASELKQHVQTNDVVQTKQTQHGTRYAVDGPIVAPDGSTLNIRSAWFIDAGSDKPRFITAYPLPRL